MTGAVLSYAVLGIFELKVPIEGAVLVELQRVVRLISFVLYDGDLIEYGVLLIQMQ